MLIALLRHLQTLSSLHTQEVTAQKTGTGPSLLRPPAASLHHLQVPRAAVCTYDKPPLPEPGHCTTA